MQPLVRLLAGTLAALALVAVAAAGPSVREARAGNPCYHGVDQPALTVEASTGVKLETCAFEPTVAVVPVGATVTFGSAEGGLVHLVTGANQAWGERDTEVRPGERVTYTFDEPGVYPYACVLHPGMSGAIVVGNGGPALAAAFDAGEGRAVAAAESTPTSVLLPALGAGAVLAAVAGAWLLIARRTSRGSPVARPAAE